MNSCIDAVNSGVLPLLCVMESSLDNFSDLSQGMDFGHLLESNIARHDSFINDSTHQEEVKLVSQKATEYMRKYYSPNPAQKYNPHARMTPIGDIEYNEYYSPNTSELSYDMFTHIREKVYNYCNTSSEHLSQITQCISDPSTPSSITYLADRSLPQSTQQLELMSTNLQTPPNLISMYAPNGQYYHPIQEEEVEGSSQQIFGPTYQMPSPPPTNSIREGALVPLRNINNLTLDAEALAKKLRHNKMEKDRRKQVAAALDVLSDLLCFSGTKKPSKTVVLMRARNRIRELDNEYFIKLEKNTQILSRLSLLIQAYISNFRC